MHGIFSMREAELPLPQELVGPMEAEVRERVCEYLLKGHVLYAAGGHSWCRFRCGIANHRMGSCELTDGEWVWPEGLVHYVREHEVLLPEAFVARALSGREPKIPEEERPVSLEFWLRWVEEWRRRQVRRLDEGMGNARLLMCESAAFSQRLFFGIVA